MIYEVKSMRNILIAVGSGLSGANTDQLADREEPVYTEKSHP